MTTETSPPVLSDGRVTLRGLTERDIQGCYEQCVDPLTAKWSQVPVPFSWEDAEDFCLRRAPAGWSDGSEWIFAVEADGRYCGNIALRDEGHGRAELAYGAHPIARGAGVMEPALRLLIGWGFGSQGVKTIIWRSTVGNWASRKLAWRLGFSFDGVLRESQVFRGELVTAWIGTLRSSDQRKAQGRWLVADILEADGLRLRPPTSTDVPRIVEACSDGRTTRWLARMPQPYADKDAHAWIEENLDGQAKGDSVTWVVVDPEEDVLLATVNLFDIGQVSAEVGYWAHPDARGRGVVTRATRAAVAWGFEQLGLRVIQAHAALDNVASRHVLEAAGFELGGTVPWGTRTVDGDVDAAVYYRSSPSPT